MRDAFFELPLNKWQVFESKTLNKAKIVLLHDLRPVVDMFNSDDSSVGIGSRTVSETVEALNLSDNDRERLMGLMSTRSFDVYSVRAALNDFLSDEELSRIKLGPEEQKRLEKYLGNYSRGLLRTILDGSDVKISDRASLSSLFDENNRDVVQKNIVGLAKKLRIRPDEIVVYIARLSEIILAISYYNRVYDNSKPALRGLLTEIKALHDDPGLHFRFPTLKRDTRKALTYGTKTFKLMDTYFNDFKRVEGFFDEITPEKFRRLREAVAKHYQALGMILCYWQIKITAWEKRFYDRDGRPKDSTGEQRYKFFQDNVVYNLDSLDSFFRVIETADLPI